MLAPPRRKRPALTVLAAIAAVATAAAATVTGMALAAAAATGCRVTYAVNQWSTGFTATVTVTNLGDPITAGWQLEWDFPGNQRITQAWNATFAQSGAHATLTAVDWNRSLATGASASPGFNASYSGVNANPASFTLNGTTCTGATSSSSAASSGSSSSGSSSSSSSSSRASSSSSRSTSSSSSRSSSSSSSSQSAGTSPFKGVGNAACGDLGRLRMSWWYNWYVDPGSCTTGEYVPMVSGKDKHGAGDIAWTRDQAINRGYKTILGFNEPNKADQANMSVATAVDLWPTLTANPSIRIGSPATSADGQAWFTDFMNQVAARNLRVDFIALHWYGWNAGSCDANATQLENYLRWAESFPGNRPIWLTEFGCMNASNPDMATVTAFYRGALAVFARHPRVERYAWYPWNTNNALVDASGNLTALGTVVANAPATR